MEIKVFPNPILLKETQLVDTNFLPYLELALPEMKRIVLGQSVLGLAAPQVGISKRFCLIKLSSGHILTLINPVIVESSGTIAHKEGCLSFPNCFEMVKRKETIIIEFDTSGIGEICRMELSGIDAVVAQHEIDHLDGIVFTERMSTIRSSRVFKALKQVKRNGY
jgi:peptide deformylase